MRSSVVLVLALAAVAATGVTALPNHYWYVQTYNASIANNCTLNVISTDYYGIDTCVRTSTGASLSYTVVGGGATGAIQVNTYLAVNSPCLTAPVVSPKTYLNLQCRHDASFGGLQIANPVLIHGPFPTASEPRLYATTDYSDSACTANAEGPRFDVATGACDNGGPSSTRSSRLAMTGSPALLTTCVYGARDCQGTEVCQSIRPGCIDLAQYGSSGSIYYDYVGAGERAAASTLLVAALAAVAYFASAAERL